MIYTLFHPFDGFYELRFSRKQNPLLIGLLFVLYGLAEVVRMQYTGVLMRTWDTYGFNGALTFVSALFPLALFVISNWSVTTLTEGNGRLSDIALVLAYACVPKILISLVVTVASNFVIQEEIIILTTVELFGTVIFCFLVFAGLCVVHEYTPWKTVVTVLLSALAAAVIFFIALFYFSIMDKIIGFISSVITEISN